MKIPLKSMNIALERPQKGLFLAIGTPKEIREHVIRVLDLLRLADSDRGEDSDDVEHLFLASK